MKTVEGVVFWNSRSIEFSVNDKNRKYLKIEKLLKKKKTRKIWSGDMVDMQLPIKFSFDVLCLHSRATVMVLASVRFSEIAASRGNKS